MQEIIQGFLFIGTSGTAFLLAGLFYGLSKYLTENEFQYGGRLLVSSMALLGTVKAIILFLPFTKMDPNYALACFIPVLGAFPLIHLIYRKKIKTLPKIFLIVGFLSPFLYFLKPINIFLTGPAIITGLSWILVPHKRFKISYKKTSTILSILCGVTLICFGCEFFFTNPIFWIKKFDIITIILNTLEMALCISGATLIIWKLYNKRSQIDFALLLTLALIGYICGFFVSVKGIEKEEQVILNNELNTIKLYKEKLSTIRERSLGELKLLNANPSIYKLILINDIKTRSKLNRFLEQSSLQLNAEAIYVMDKTGRVVASSTPVFLDQNYSFRPYFQKALSGQSNMYLAKGITSHKVGAFFARPLANSDGLIRYVLVMKLSLDDILCCLRNENLMLMGTYGEVLMGPKPFENTILFPLPKDPKLIEGLRIELGGQFPQRTPGLKYISKDQLIDTSGNTYRLITFLTGIDGWRLAKLINYNDFFLNCAGTYFLAVYVTLVAISLLGLRSIQVREWAARLHSAEKRRKKAEEEKYLLSTIIEQAKDAILLTDTSGIIQYLNEAASFLIERKADELSGRSIDILSPNKVFFTKQMKNKLNKGAAWHGHVSVEKNNGNIIEADCTVFPITWQNSQLKYVIILKDITKEIQLEKQLIQAQKMEAVGTLAGGIAHDFNNLLTALQGYAEIGLTKLDNNHPVTAYLNQICQTTDRAASIVKQLLIFSRQEIGDKVSINLNNIILDMHKTILRLIGENIRINLDLEENLPNILADPVNMDQILMNFIVNAKDAIEGNGEIIIQTRRVDLITEEIKNFPSAKSGHYVRLSVKDTGKGIPTEIIDKIFDPFFSTKAKGKGTGLGLSVTYSIVKRHNGWIHVSSEKGKGTIFNVYLPTISTTSQKSEDHSLNISSKENVLDGQGRKVLFLEDEEAIIEIGVKYLTQCGFQVLPAKNIKQAKTILQQSDIDIIVADIVLPDGNGFEFLNNHADGRPVIFCTGYIDQTDIKTKIMSMGWQFLNKPYSKKDLFKAIAKII